jgi:hypothetical protein
MACGCCVLPEYCDKGRMRALLNKQGVFL